MQFILYKSDKKISRIEENNLLNIFNENNSIEDNFKDFTWHSENNKIIFVCRISKLVLDEVNNLLNETNYSLNFINGWYGLEEGKLISVNEINEKDIDLDYGYFNYGLLNKFGNCEIVSSKISPSLFYFDNKSNFVMSNNNEIIPEFIKLFNNDEDNTEVIKLFDGKKITIDTNDEIQYVYWEDRTYDNFKIQKLESLIEECTDKDVILSLLEILHLSSNLYSENVDIKEIDEINKTEQDIGNLVAKYMIEKQFNSQIKDYVVLLENKISNFKNKELFLENQLSQKENEIKKINEKTKFAYHLEKYITARMDLKNIGNKSNKIQLYDISDDNADISSPFWFTDDKGTGLCLKSFTGEISFKIKCINNGNLNIELRTLDVKDHKGNRFPVYIDYLSFKVNNEEILKNNTLTWHDKPIIFTKKVTNDETIDIKVKWQPFTSDSVYR